MSRPPQNTERNARIIAMRRDGMRTREIAAALKLTDGRVRQLLCEAGETIPGRGGIYISDAKKRAVLAHADRAGVKGAADAHGVGWQSVYRWRAEADAKRERFPMKLRRAVAL